VPVELSEIASTGFLRKFNFQTLARQVMRDLWGDVAVPAWFQVTINSRPELQAQSFVFTISVRLLEHGWEADLGPTRLTPSKKRQVGLKVERGFGLEFPVPQNVIQQFKSELPTMFTKFLEGALLGNAHRLYELDPRIGWRHGFNGDPQLSTSRLLDPRGPFSRTGVPFVTTAPEGWDPISGHKPPRCSFCREDHSRAEPPVWAGANLMWVHARCWGPS
jgi:hypothetical protein